MFNMVSDIIGEFLKFGGGGIHLSNMVGFSKKFNIKQHFLQNVILMMDVFGSSTNKLDVIKSRKKSKLLISEIC
jgi:hypothetical protein